MSQLQVGRVDERREKRLLAAGSSGRADHSAFQSSEIIRLTRYLLLAQARGDKSPSLAQAGYTLENAD